MLTVGRRRHASTHSRGFTRRFVVSRRTMRRLRSALHDANWPGLRADYPANPPVADGFHYATTYRARQVTTEDGAKRPKRLNRVLEILQRIVGRHGGFV
jgi:hypothetical protein